MPLVLHHADVRTMDPSLPRASAVLVRGERIACVGDNATVRSAAGARYDDLDCAGDVVAPAFIDPHIHLLAYAAALAAVDCSPARVRSIPELMAAIARRAAQTPPGDWIRAVGYRESELLERRHPSRWELDAAAPQHPVRLTHGSGHACVLNTRALQIAGITSTTEEPPGGVLGRRLSDGEPDGLLMGTLSRMQRAIPLPGYADLRVRVALASAALLAAGVTAIHDLGTDNDHRTVALLKRLSRDGALGVDAQVAIGFDAFLAGSDGGRSGQKARGRSGTPSRASALIQGDGAAFPKPLDQCRDHGLQIVPSLRRPSGESRTFGSSSSARSRELLAAEMERDCTVSAPLLPDGVEGGRSPIVVKLTIEETGDERDPGRTVLAERIRTVHRAGLRVAVHCISAAAVCDALCAFELALSGVSGAVMRHRLEHAAVCPPDLARRAAGLGLTVVSNLGFLATGGNRYLRELPAGELPHLYDAAGLCAAGVSVCAGSDAPFGPLEPLRSIDALMRRRSASGERLPGRTIDLEAALALHTREAARAIFRERERGMVRAGLAADLVRLPRRLEFDAGTRIPISTMRAGAWVEATV